VKIKTYSELEVWQKADELALLVFRITERFPNIDRFGIVSQVRRSCASVPANIAEGFGRGTTREFLRSLQIARGELEETRYFMLLSRDSGKISAEDFSRINTECDSAGRLINVLGRSLRSRLENTRQPSTDKADRRL
jgi:four helix bundle protein